MMIVTTLFLMMITPATAQGYRDEQTSTHKEDRYNAYDERGEWQPGKQYSTPRHDRYNTYEERGYSDDYQRSDRRRGRDETYEERAGRYR
jgi:hypothetical protein